MPSTNGDSSAAVTATIASSRRARPSTPPARTSMWPWACKPSEEIPIAEARSDRRGLAGDRGGSFEVACCLVTEKAQGSSGSHARLSPRARPRAAAGHERASRPQARSHPVGEVHADPGRGTHRAQRLASLEIPVMGTLEDAIASSSRPNIRAVVNSSRSSASSGACSSAREKASYAPSHEHSSESARADSRSVIPGFCRPDVACAGIGRTHERAGGMLLLPSRFPSPLRVTPFPRRKGWSFTPSLSH